MSEPVPASRPSVLGRASLAGMSALLGAALGVWVGLLLGSGPSELEFPEASVAFKLPGGWDAFVAGDYALAASPVTESDAERILAISHRGATSAGMLQVMSPLVREGPGGFYVSGQPLSECFDVAWVQRGEGDAPVKYIAFRESGKLELRIESGGGKERLDALLGSVRCAEPASAPAAGAIKEPTLGISCRVLEPAVAEPAGDPRCAHLARYYGDIHLAFDRLMREAPGAFGQMRFELTSDPSLLTTIASLVDSEMGAHQDFERAVSIGVAKIPYLPAQYGATKLELTIRVNLPEEK